MSKTNIGLVEYAKAQLGNPYWYGTYGATASESLYKAKKKQYPQYYTATDFPSQYGKRVHDCVGLIKGYWWSETPTSAPKYNKNQDTSANGLRKACIEQGDISTIPEIPGVCVFYDGHVGVYIGNGEVIEARGHAYGVVKTKLKGRGWKYWGKIPNIEYITDTKPEVKEPEFKEGDVVEFTGTKHYTSANGSTSRSCKPGLATVVDIYQYGKSKHPYLLKKVAGGTSNVNGWCNIEDLKAVKLEPSYQCIHTVVKGDSLWALAKKYLGKGSRYPEIVALNNLPKAAIFEGDQLKIPHK